MAPLSVTPPFVRQILHNCDVSDARHAGLYSICGLALRLRDLYKWDRGVPPWHEDASERVLAWIGDKEAHWETLANADFCSIEIDHRYYDPFDTDGINRVLAPSGLFYGAGYAYSLKPTFFLAQIDAQDHSTGRTVWSLGHEFARDLATLPAFCQEGEIVLRTDAARMYLWDQIIYAENSAKPALRFALEASCGTGDLSAAVLRPNLERIFQVQTTVYIRHEVGELADTVFARPVWRQLVADHAHTPVELLVRVLKDMLADTDPQGTLPDIIERQDAAALGLYMAFGRTMTLTLFHELPAAFTRFRLDRDWRALGDVVAAVRDKAVAYCREIMAICGSPNPADGCSADPAVIRSEIERTMRQRHLFQ